MLCIGSVGLAVRLGSIVGCCFGELEGCGVKIGEGLTDGAGNEGISPYSIGMYRSLTVIAFVV
jgi:hypothetical protein